MGRIVTAFDYRHKQTSRIVTPEQHRREIQANYHRQQSMSTNLVPDVTGQPMMSGYVGHNRLRTRIASMMGQSYELSPRHIGYGMMHEFEANFEIVPKEASDLDDAGIYGPEVFAKEELGKTGRKFKKPFFVVGTAKGVPGQPEEKMKWRHIPKVQVPSRLDGKAAWLSSAFGAERCMENIVYAENPGGTRDVIVHHVSDPTDRHLAVINPDQYDANPKAKNLAARNKLIDLLESLPMEEIERTEIVETDSKGRIKTLRLFHETMKNAEGQHIFWDADVNFLGLTKDSLYYNPEDERYSLRFVCPTEHQEFEHRGERQHISTHLTEVTTEVNDTTRIRVARRENGEFVVHFDQDVRLELGPKDNLTIVRCRQLANEWIEISIANQDKKLSFSIPPASMLEGQASPEEVLRADAKFLEQNEFVQKAILSAFQQSVRKTATAKSPLAFRKTKLYRNANFWLRHKINQAFRKYLDESPDNHVHSRARDGNVRRRYQLKYYRTRQTRLSNVLERPLSADEFVVVSRVKGSARVAHVNDHNGRTRNPDGTFPQEIIPLPFDPLEGHSKTDSKLVVRDAHSRPNAMHKTSLVIPLETALTGQALVSPYATGQVVTPTDYGIIDQQGFFGIFQLAAMAFPNGGIFKDPRMVNWVLSNFGSVPHSIFDQKADAGMRRRFLTGNPILNFMMTCAAITTGPNTDTVNPAREGTLFSYIRPGTRAVLKSGIPSIYLTVIEDALGSYLRRTIFGLATQTSIFPLSAGGAADNAQVILAVQRGKRWNAGIGLWLMDGYHHVGQDLTYGNPVYRTLYQGKSALAAVIKDYRTGNKLAQRAAQELGVDLKKIPTIGADEEAAPITLAQRVRLIDPKAPRPRMFKFNEWREVLGVGTWYLVSFAKTVAYLAIPMMALTALMPLPVVGAIFLLTCLATTLFSWPFWTLQLCKMGVNPKYIMSLKPHHLFFGEMSIGTQNRANLDIERLALGPFRISIRSMGARLAALDKRTAAILGTASLVGGGAFVLGAGVLSLAWVGLGSFLLSVGPILALGLLGKFLGRVAKTYLPNPGHRSFKRSLVHWLSESVPLVTGLTLSLLLTANVAIFAFPLTTILMAGGWSMFMGVNMLRNLVLYHKDQKKMHLLAKPNPLTISKENSDSWRNTIREIFMREAPAFTDLEFTRQDDPNMAPDVLWRALNGVNVADTFLAHKDYEQLVSYLQQHSMLDASGFVSRYFNEAELRSILPEKCEENFGLSANRIVTILSGCRPGITPNLLDKPKDSFTNVNMLIDGEGSRMIDLYSETQHVRPAILSNIEDSFVRWWAPMSWVKAILTRRGQIASRVQKTQRLREGMASLPRHLQTYGELSATSEEKDALRELNRLVLEEVLPGYAPRRLDGVFAPTIELVRDIRAFVRERRRSAA